MHRALIIMSKAEQPSRIDPIPNALIMVNEIMDAKENCVPIMKNVLIFFDLSASSDSCRIP